MMEVTTIRFHESRSPDRRLLCHATVTLDHCLAVHDVRVIHGAAGLFLAMPARKAQLPCPACGRLNAVRSKFCNECGRRLPAPVPGPAKDHHDIVHPLDQATRERLTRAVLAAWERHTGGGG